MPDFLYVTDVASCLLMDVPGSSFGAHMLIEHILMASSRGTAADRSSFQSITHDALAPTHVSGTISYQEKGHRHALSGSRCKNSTFCREVKCHKLTHTIQLLNMTKRVQTLTFVSTVFTHTTLYVKSSRGFSHGYFEFP